MFTLIIAPYICFWIRNDLLSYAWHILWKICYGNYTVLTFQNSNLSCRTKRVNPRLKHRSSFDGAITYFCCILIRYSQSCTHIYNIHSLYYIAGLYRCHCTCIYSFFRNNDRCKAWYKKLPNVLLHTLQDIERLKMENHLQRETQ